MWKHLEPYLETADKFAHYLQDLTKLAQFISKTTSAILMRSISMSDQIKLRALPALSMRSVSGVLVAIGVGESGEDHWAVGFTLRLIHS